MAGSMKAASWRRFCLILPAEADLDKRSRMRALGRGYPVRQGRPSQIGSQVQVVEVAIAQ